MEDDYAAQRRPADATPIDKQVYRWWATLPENKRPVQLAKRFPRIVNRIAACWNLRGKCALYLSSLMVDPLRTDRRGFPYEIALEILALQTLLAEEDPNAGMHKDGEFKFGGE